MESAATFVAECFCPDVDDAEVRKLGARAARAATELAGRGRPVRYLGSLLMRDDEVVLFQFEGTADAVRSAAERARIPFERILATTSSGAPAPRSRRAEKGER